MRRLLFILLFATSAFAAAPRRIVIEGRTPYDRGLAHGRMSRGDIHELVRRWSNDIHENFGIGADEFAKRFLARTHYVDAIRTWTPDLLDEVRGIADGASVPYETMLVYQLGDEMWTEGGDVSKHCTSVGVDRRGTQPAMVAQNMDIEPFYGGFVVVLEIHGDGPHQFVLTYPGLIALNGMNRNAIGVCTNTLERLAGSRDGLPVAFVVRGILRQRSFADAERFLKTVRHASGQNYMLGDREHAISFEASAGKVVALKQPLAGCVYHTNFPIANDDRRAKADVKFEGRERYDIAGRELHDRQTLEAIERGLRAPKVSNDFTFASTIMILGGNRPKLLVSSGRPDRGAYTRLRFP
jgi:hypothetical protein